MAGREWKQSPSLLMYFLLSRHASFKVGSGTEEQEGNSLSLFVSKKLLRNEDERHVLALKSERERI
jgi:hypothetical protein